MDNPVSLTFADTGAPATVDGAVARLLRGERPIQLRGPESAVRAFVALLQTRLDPLLKAAS